GRIEELAPAYHAFAHPALAHLERTLFSDEQVEPAATDGAVRFLEGAGARGAVELVADEILELIRSGAAPEQIAVVCPSLERFRAVLETAFGHALLSLLRYAWLGAGRPELYAFMRSPFSGLRREHVDFLEGRLRGRAVRSRERVE